MRQLPRWITRKMVLATLLIGLLLLLVAAVAYGQEVVGSWCLNGDTSESTGSGTCSYNGGIDRDRGEDGSRTVTTFLGTEPAGWFGATKWPAFALGLISTVAGLIGLGATSTLVTKDTKPDRRAAKPKLIQELGLLAGSPLELSVRVTKRKSGGYGVEMSTPTIQSLRSLHKNELPADRGIAQLTSLVKSAGKRRFGSNKAKAVEAFGADLFDALFIGACEKAYRDSVNFAREHNGSLRISLQVDEQFADIPWEYLYDAALGSFLALSRETSLVRRIETTHSTRSHEPIGCLRILSMSASPTHLAGLDVAAERARTKTALAPAIADGQARLDFVDGGSMAALYQALKISKPHVFHFAGHGVWDEDRDDGVLFFEDEHGSRHPVTGRELGRLLNGSDVRLAIFNSCNGARPSKVDRFAGIASSLVAQGVPAAIGMQFNFDDKAAVTFGSTLLSELAAGVPIDAALTDARLAVFTLPNDMDWGTPVLTTRVGLDQIIPRSDQTLT